MAGAQEAVTAESLSRSGQHAQAARAYEKQAKRLFRAWDTRLTLLAAREYAAAAMTDDAERMLGKISGRPTGDDAVLLGRVEAEVALARGDGAAAVAAIDAIPKPWPAPLESELLLLQAQGYFRAGRTLDGVRTLEQRGRLLGAADARDANYQLLVESLQKSGTVNVVPPQATDGERAWFELAQLRASATDDPEVARRAFAWRTRHPNHPGAPLLPELAGTTAGGAALSVLPVGQPAAVALLLPLSGRQEAAGIAVRDGFLAGYLDRPDVAPRVRVYDTASMGAAAAYQKALADGAEFVVGPLTKDDVALVAAGQLPVPTLALNAYSAEGPPPFLFQFTLDPEQEARETARRIAADGHVRGIALFPRSAWGERVQSAFAAELQVLGVELSGAQFYDPGARDFSGPLRAALGRYGGAGDRGKNGQPAPARDGGAESMAGPQFAFLAANAQTARALRPQLRFQMSYDLPVYATSDAWDPSTRVASDLEGLTFPEMPWILHDGEGASALWGVLQREWVSEGRGRLRLYAFGYDAVALVSELRAGRTTTAVDGLTGRLTFGPGGSVQRQLDWARIEGGKPRALGASVPMAPSVP